MANKSPNKLGKIGRVHVLASAEYRQTHFMCRQWTSILLLLYPSLFTNSFEWFTVWCEYPCLFKLWYDFQQSETINVPGSIQSFMIGKCCLAPIFHCHQKTSPWIFFYTAKYPLSFNAVPSMVFSLSHLTFTNLKHFPFTTNLFTFFRDGHFTFLCKTYPSRQLCWH